ncbi:MAG TPA: phosphate permease, partial [Saprospirales bacterium]|nr:phosphate permease [Saprospirales bacterium]
VVIASGNAMPISTTHTLVGAVFGVGLAMSIKDLDFKVVGQIVASWLTTVPAGAILSMIFLTLFRYLFQI